MVFEFVKCRCVARNSSFSLQSYCLFQKICMDLREYFNKLFDEMFVQKEREMGVLAERNGRLRTILSELRITCNGQSLLFHIAISNF